MNIIPTTFKRIRVPYTVLGGRKRGKKENYSSLVSILLLNRGGRLYRNETFTELEKAGASEIISVEGSGSSHDMEALAKKFPHITFLRLHKPTTRGEEINIGIEECAGKFVFVLWNDMRVASLPLSSRLFEKIEKQGALCIVPFMHNQRMEPIPCIQAPAFDKKRLRIIPLQPSENLPTLYPFDFTGIYHREKYIQSGGYDYSLENEYWQKLDFGFRSHMWGEKTVCNMALKVNYLWEVPSEDTTPDQSYKIFYLKNLSVRFQGDTGVLPGTRLLPYLFRAGGIFSGVKEFKAVKKWVEINRFRFTQDARAVTELWEVNEN